MVEYILISKRFKILIIDDSEKNRGELTEMLEREFDVINASDAKQGIEMINKYGEDIALLLLEVKICGMSGFEVLTYMKHSGITENIPVIMKTMCSNSMLLLSV